MKNGLQQLDSAVTGLNQSQDRDALLQAHNTAFCLPFRFLYQPHEGDQVTHENDYLLSVALELMKSLKYFGVVMCIIVI